ncbi:uncharacterized protein LOC107633838 [Arachis ipaensis]|uniref:uncharacterized protein LOC107633838 n=1 Tax=Arachis ipaensis TaxID=130454 RepID=UPI0007AEFFA7|nr:uncharacterized protein LOC107633838 [Arachis ipaensis]
MRLNPLKCAFAMEAGKFLGFMITQRGVEANPEKCQAILQMKSLGCIKDVQRLAGRLTALSRFLGASAAKALPFFNLMKKGIAFEWTPACEEAFNHFKETLATPPVLGKPKAGEPLYLYLAVTEEALAAVLVITRFGIPEVVISDNGTQFTDKKFTEFLTGLGVKQKFSSVEHPQTNGQVESANKVILLGLKKRLDNKKGAWADELASVLWSYRTTEQSATGETPFRLTYGVDAVIPVEIGEPSPRLLLAGVDEAVEKDLVEETREMAHLSETALK